MKKMKTLVLVAGLVIGGFAFLAAEGHAAKMCDYEYYYDAAHTQYAGYCYAACYAGGNICIGDLTAYYALVNCRPAGTCELPEFSPTANCQPPAPAES